MVITVILITIVVLSIAWYIAYKYDYKKLVADKSNNRYSYQNSWESNSDDELKPRDSWKGDTMQYTIAFILSFVLGLASALFMLCACVDWIPQIVEGKAVEYKIEMYEEENTEIENDIEKIVAQYYEHEKVVFDMSEINSATTLIQMYPELKSDELVIKQMDIYKANNDAIKSLKIDQINCQKAKWWLYFGDVEVK